ncbi:MAG: O-antigen ligase family protein, partial [Defluviitaleaceae bacterium]|nr:O-antigen ligase family protein [Defluviitaleaceae bacterium]
MKKNRDIFDVLVGASLLVVVGIMPLIARLAWRPLHPELSNLFSFDGYPDFLSYWKSIFVLFPAIAIAFLYVSDLITRGNLPDLRKFIKKPPVIFSGVFLIFMLISTVFSQFSRTAWLGTYHRDEGAFMWMAYFVIFFAAVHFGRKIENAKYILYALAFSSIIMGAIGVSQFAGRDFFNTGLAQWLVTVGTPFFDQRSDITIAFEIAYGTLFNPNTFGKYSAMLSPVLIISAITLFISAHVKKDKRFIAASAVVFLAGLLMLFSVFASSSLGGLIGIITAAIVLAVTLLVFGINFIRRSEEKITPPQKRTMVIAAVSSLGLILAMIVAIGLFPPLNERVTFLFNRIGREMAADTTAMNNYVFNENVMTVYGSDGKILSLTVHGSDGELTAITVRDAAGNEVLPASQYTPPELLFDGEEVPRIPATTYTYEIPNYREVTIAKAPHEFAYLHAGNVEPFFLAYDNGRIYGIHGVMHMGVIFDTRPGALLDLHRDIPAWGFEGRETWGSSRGYIWSRSFPLMPSRTIIGSGPDSFINVFPNHDMVSGRRYFNNPYQIVDKAHNFFIQTWITTGGISALALFGLFGHYIITTFLSLAKSKDEPIFSFGLRLGLLAGISAFCMAGMATDTTIGSMGVFIVLLGVGYGVNVKTSGA